MIKQLALGVLAFAATAGPSFAVPFISNPGRYDGGRISIQTQSGTSCSATAPDRASIGVAAGYEDNDSYSYGGGYGGGNNSGFVGGVYVSMPLGGKGVGDCSTILEMEQQRARLDMAVTLFEAGAMTADELKEIADSVKGAVRGDQARTIRTTGNPSFDNND